MQGGLIGQMLWDWCYVDKCWLPESVRGTGAGAAVLAAAEERAIERGCRWAHLQTLDFQALSFYQRRGYAVFGVLDGYPPGSRRYYLRKTLLPGAAQPCAPRSIPARPRDGHAPSDGNGRGLLRLGVGGGVGGHSPRAHMVSGGRAWAIGACLIGGLVFMSREREFAVRL